MTTVAHFPPFDTLDATPDKTEQSGSCSGLGCDGDEGPRRPRRHGGRLMGAFASRFAAGYRGTCTTCLGLGCNDCCHTGLADIPPDAAPDMPLALDVSQGWDLMIRRASNGYIVRGWSFDDRGLFDTLIEDDPTDDAVRRLLWEVIEQLGVSGSRYDAERIFVGYRPGDKHHDYHPRPCAECECGCEPDQSTQEVGAMTPTEEPTCCELACYEDPGCLCDGCAPPEAMTPTEAIMAALDKMTSLYGPCLMDDEDWSDGFLAALPPGWRLCGPDDATVTVDRLARALEHTPWLERHVGRREYADIAAAILAALSADTDGRERAESITTPAERYAGRQGGAEVTELTTPTGKRLWDEEHEYNGAGNTYRDAILAIEQEARARLLAGVENEVAYYFEHGHFAGCAMLDPHLDEKDCDCGPLALLDLLADPEPVR